MFFTKGVGYHRNKLQSFELALRNAGIEKCNLVYVSSILPPDCKIISKEVGIKQLSPGQITFVVLARESTNEPKDQGQHSRYDGSVARTGQPSNEPADDGEGQQGRAPDQGSFELAGVRCLEG